uniref:Tail completion protein n=1 Tax=Dulem virus 32 TaxID=3145750 RepID=A0AAU8B1D2_9CAUD
MTAPLLGDVIPELIRILAPLGVPVVPLVPAKRPPELVRVTPAGGDAEGPWLARPIVTVEVWAGTPKRARYLAQQARDLILDAAETSDLIHDAEATMPVFLPDPDTPIQRAVFTTQLVII